MPDGNHKHNTKNDKKRDEKFRSKHINHDPVSESARAKFGFNGQ